MPASQPCLTFSGITAMLEATGCGLLPLTRMRTRLRTAVEIICRLGKRSRLFSTALAEHTGVVRADRLEAAHAFLSFGFSSQLRLSPPRPPPCRRVCGLDYPFTMLRPGRWPLLEGRCCPSSLYTFPVR